MKQRYKETIGDKVKQRAIKETKKDTKGEKQK